MPNVKHTSKKHLAHLEVVHRQDRIIRISALIIILLVVGLVGYGFLSGTVLLPYRTVATVNGEKITAGEFQAQVKVQRIQAINRYMQYMQYAQMFGVQDPLNDANFGPLLKQDTSRLTDTNIMGQEVIDLLINDRLIRQEAKKRNISISKDELDKALHDSFAYFPNGTPTAAPTATVYATPTLSATQLALVTITPTASPAPTETATATATPDANQTPTQAPTSGPSPTALPSATPAPTATAVSAEGYQTLLKERVDGLQKETGLDNAGYLHLIETSLLRDKLMLEIGKDIKHTQTQVWARHILVKTNEEALTVLKRLNAGEDFGKLAAEVSLDTSNKNTGGDLGWFGPGAMVAPFEKVAFAQTVGQISEPVQTDFGFHIIQTLGHEDRPVDDQTFQNNQQTALTEFLTQLRTESKVEVFDLWKTIVPTEPAMPTTPQ